MAAPTKSHRKPDAERRDDRIPVRVTAVQKAMLAEGARRSSVEVSTWLRSLAIRECRALGITEETVAGPASPPRTEPAPQAKKGKATRATEPATPPVRKRKEG